MTQAFHAGWAVVKGEEPIERRTEAKVDALLDAQNLAVPPNKPKKKKVSE